MNPLAADATRRNLQAHLDCVAELETLLQAERRALEANDADALERIAAAKRTAVVSLDRLGGERERLAAGLPMQQVCEHSATQPLWQRLLAETAALKERNEANGMLLQTRRVQVRGALARLGGDTPLYGRGGLDAASAPARLIGSA